VTGKNRSQIAVVAAVAFLVSAEIVLHRLDEKRVRNSTQKEFVPDSIHPVFRATFLAFGDVNLGRWLGQKIIKGDIDFPFARINLTKDSADIIFANLECPLSDQKGETGDPKNNLVFTGPPQGTQTLKNAGITVVSTANNHAFDYHEKAVYETLDRLTAAGILHVGSSKSKEKLFDPIIIEENNIKIAIFAVTAFMNFTPKNWQNVVASSDTIRLLEKIKKVRNTVDVVVLSYHGGVEYADHPAEKVKQFALWCVNNGVDIFIGHHPHVTFGIEKIGHKIVIYSLGNFVFYQPQQYWTQRSYGVQIRFEKKDSVTTYKIERILPLEVSFQTRLLNDSIEVQKLFTRTQKLSNFDLKPVWE
jgi:poly-gamma-glutamate capsule biosynthesis protein CapA/YwtB (metallophosphatase superfamily)